MYKRNGKKLSIENAMGDNVILIDFDIKISNISKIIDTYEEHLESERIGLSIYYLGKNKHHYLYSMF